MLRKIVIAAAVAALLAAPGVVSADVHLSPPRPTPSFAVCAIDLEIVHDATLGALCSGATIDPAVPDGVALPLLVVTIGGGGLDASKEVCPDHQCTWLGVLYEHTHYNSYGHASGRQMNFYVNQANWYCRDHPDQVVIFPDLRPTGFDNEASSARAHAAAGCGMDLYQHPHQQGSVATCHPDCEDLHDFPTKDPKGGTMNDRTSSVRFHGW